MTSDVRQDQDPAGSRACDIIASNGLRITNQRVALLKVLLESEDHPDGRCQLNSLAPRKWPVLERQMLAAPFQASKASIR